MKYGAAGAKWAPFDGTETSSAKPTYGTVVDFGGINESNDTLNFASASAYADDKKQIEIKKFTDGTIDTKALYQPIATTSEILGTSTDGDGGQTFGSDDDAPYGGYGFYSQKMDASKNKYYVVVFYPKVQASVSNSNYKTTEDALTLEYDSIQFSIFATLYEINGSASYKIEKQFSSVSEATAYLDELFAGTATWPGETEASE